MHIDPQIGILAVATCAVGYLMVVAGMQKNALEWRRRRRMCPSCGRTIDARVCRTCSS